MNICGLVGSPIKKGNIDILVSSVLKGAETQGAHIQKIYLNDLHIQPCQSCGTDPYPEFCHFDDDMNLIYDSLTSCDCIILGSPVYFDTVSAQTKLMIDRCNCLMPYTKQPDGTFQFERRLHNRKRGIFIASAGMNQEFNTILTTLNGFFQWANIELVEKILYAHEGGRGCVGDDKETVNRAFEMGVTLARGDD